MTEQLTLMATLFFELGAFVERFALTPGSLYREVRKDFAVRGAKGIFTPSLGRAMVYSVIVLEAARISLYAGFIYFAAKAILE